MPFLPFYAPRVPRRRETRGHGRYNRVSRAQCSKSAFTRVFDALFGAAK
jgi:hypothetical protein